MIGATVGRRRGAKRHCQISRNAARQRGARRQRRFCHAFHADTGAGVLAGLLPAIAGRACDAGGARELTGRSAPSAAAVGDAGQQPSPGGSGQADGAPAGAAAGVARLLMQEVQALAARPSPQPVGAGYPERQRGAGAVPSIGVRGGGRHPYYARASLARRWRPPAICTNCCRVSAAPSFDRLLAHLQLCCGVNCCSPRARPLSPESPYIGLGSTMNSVPNLAWFSLTNARRCTHCPGGKSRRRSRSGCRPRTPRCHSRLV